ncbi:MAG TPA: hypothetical protein VM222_05455, partial [Planctomycetota bacterium]|nr:hypothetical protein [Planctomycetota bacterium]
EKIGVMFGSPETTPGGRALKFYSSVRVDVRRIGHLKEGEVEIGTRVKAHIVKNKIAPPFKKVEFDMLFASGISYEGDVLDLGEIHGVLERSGGWYSYKGEKIDNGREKCRGILKTKPALALKIENDIRAKVGMEPRQAPGSAKAAAAAPAPDLTKKSDDDKKPAKK